MKEQIKNKWVKALRSGEYEQSVCHLKSTKGYCCLGVLTDLYIKEAGQDWDKSNEIIFEFEGKVSTLPLSVMSWSGIKETLAKNQKIEETIENSPVSMNDSGDYTFPQIADAIEKHWKEL